MIQHHSLYNELQGVDIFKLNLQNWDVIVALCNIR
jgi:hypothetical protein